MVSPGLHQKQEGVATRYPGYEFLGVVLIVEYLHGWRK